MTSQLPGSVRPSTTLLAAEMPRALLELGTTAALRRLLAHLPVGDGHPVLVLPGFTADDNSTRLLRGWLREKGYQVHGWRLGINLGPTPRILEGLLQRLDGLRRLHSNQPISLVGWSLGGIYA
ncbi:MAG: esterase/lipase family protein, partial [Acidimicrobiales bacterium]